MTLLGRHVFCRLMRKALTIKLSNKRWHVFQASSFQQSDTKNQSYSGLFGTHVLKKKKKSFKIHSWPLNQHLTEHSKFLVHLAAIEPSLYQSVGIHNWVRSLYDCNWTLWDSRGESADKDFLPRSGNYLGLAYTIAHFQS